MDNKSERITSEIPGAWVGQPRVKEPEGSQPDRRRREPPGEEPRREARTTSKRKVGPGEYLASSRSGQRHLWRSSTNGRHLRKEEDVKQSLPSLPITRGGRIPD